MDEMYDGRRSSRAQPDKTYAGRRESNSHESIPRELADSLLTNHWSESHRCRPRMVTGRADRLAGCANQMFTLKLLPPEACTLLGTNVGWSALWQGVP